VGANALSTSSGLDTRGLNNVLLLGKDHCEYGSLSTVTVGEHSAAAISVGTDQQSPSNRFKTNSEIPNEDALCVLETDGAAAFAVADAHYGPESSHTLVTRFHDRLLSGGIPATPAQLSHLIDSLQDGSPPETESETTFLTAIHNRNTGTGFGISFGDSSFLIVGPQSALDSVNHRNSRFVSTSPDQLPLEGALFHYSTEPGDVLLTYTDGIDECHYRSPETSVGRRDIAAIVSDHQTNQLEIVTELAKLAMTGVRGNPGGQDNIALITSLA
jgi:hypothetical protein